MPLFNHPVDRSRLVPRHGTHWGCWLVLVEENIFAGEATEEADENAIPSSDSEDITPVGDYETAVDQQEGITEAFEDAVQSQIQMTHGRNCR